MGIRMITSGCAGGETRLLNFIHKRVHLDHIKEKPKMLIGELLTVFWSFWKRPPFCVLVAVGFGLQACS